MLTQKPEPQISLNSPVDTNNRKYMAFISYAHEDSYWGNWLDRALRWYRVPKKLVGKKTPYGVVPKRIKPIFLDRKELSSTANLDEAIESTLQNSLSLIVVCSPNAVQSEYVASEIAYFQSLGRQNRVFCLIVDGEPNNTNGSDDDQNGCFPTPILYDVSVTPQAPRPTPLAADVRKGKDGRRDAKLRIIAAILGVDFDELRRRDLEERLQRQALGAAITLLVAVAMATLAYYAESQRQIATGKSEELRKRLYCSNYLLAATNYKVGNRVLADKLMNSCSEDLRRFEWQYLWSGQHFEELSVPLDSEKLYSVDLSSDGSKIVTGGTSGEVKLRDSKTGKILTILGIHSKRVESVAFSPDNNQIISCSPDGTVQIHTTGKPIKKIQGLPACYAVTFNRTGDKAAIGTTDGVHILDMTNYEVTFYPISDAVIKSLVFAHDGKTILCGEEGNNIYMINTETGHSIPLTQYRYGVAEIAFSPSGRYFAAAGRDGSAIVLDWNSKELIFSEQTHRGRVGALSFSNDERYLFTGGEDGSIRIWNLNTSRMDYEFTGHRFPIESMSMNLGDSVFCSVGGAYHAGNFTGDLKIWNMSARKQQVRITRKTHPPATIEFDSTGSQLLTGENDGRIMIWEAGTGKQLREIKAHSDHINTLNFIHNGTQLLSGGGDGCLRLWDFSSMKEIWSRCSDEKLFVNSVAVCAENKRAVYGDSNGKATLIDTKSGNEIAAYQVDNGPVSSVAISPNCQIIASAVAAGGYRGGNNSIRYWKTDIETKQSGYSTLILASDTESYHSSIFTPDGEKLLFAKGKDIVVWDITRNQLHSTLSGHMDNITSLTLSADGTRIISGARDKTARIWDLFTGLELTSLPIDAAVGTITISRDGSQIAADIGIEVVDFIGKNLKSDLRIWEAGRLTPSTTQPKIEPSSDESVRETTRKILTELHHLGVLRGGN